LHASSPTRVPYRGGRGDARPAAAGCTRFAQAGQDTPTGGGRCPPRPPRWTRRSKFPIFRGAGSCQKDKSGLKVLSKRSRQPWWRSNGAGRLGGRLGGKAWASGPGPKRFPPPKGKPRREAATQRDRSGIITGQTAALPKGLNEAKSPSVPRLPATWSQAESFP